MISNYAILAKHVNHDMYVYMDILKIAMKKKLNDACLSSCSFLFRTPLLIKKCNNILVVPDFQVRQIFASGNSTISAASAVL